MFQIAHDGGFLMSNCRQLHPSKFSTLISVVTMRLNVFIIRLYRCVSILPYSRVVKSTDCGRPGNLQNVKDCQPQSTVYFLLSSSPISPAHTHSSHPCFLSITAENPDITAMKDTASAAAGSLVDWAGRERRGHKLKIQEEG